jgi:hypothetical protein
MLCMSANAFGSDWGSVGLSRRSFDAKVEGRHVPLSTRWTRNAASTRLNFDIPIWHFKSNRT